MKNQFRFIKSYIIVSFTILIFTVCATKIWNYRMTEKAVKINDTELKYLT